MGLARTVKDGVFAFASVIMQAMMDLVLKIFFLLIILPFTIAQEGYVKLKSFLEKKGIKTNGLDVAIVLLIFLLLLLLALGYR